MAERDPAEEHINTDGGDDDSEGFPRPDHWGPSPYFGAILLILSGSTCTSCRPACPRMARKRSLERTRSGACAARGPTTTADTSTSSAVGPPWLPRWKPARHAARGAT